MAPKQKQFWECIECGHHQTKWAGQCPQCQQWNTLKEEVEFVGSSSASHPPAGVTQVGRPVKLSEVVHRETPRFYTQMGELDRLLGGGLVPGSLTLVGGDPGIGKSTLMLQLSYALARQGKTVLYVCGEESVEQTSRRAQRLGIIGDNLFLLHETQFQQIVAQVDALRPDLVVIDSIQIVYRNEIPSAPGSVVQVRETASACMHLAKGRNISIFLIGHVTKSGEIAGPRVLEHLVDTVLYFEGDRQHNFRMIRVVKNRFGPTDEIAVFQMLHSGLSEVPNPSFLFLEERRRQVAGSVVIPTLEGSRPILVEMQALVTETVFSTPSRRCTGIDQSRLALLIAVLEKRMRYQMFRYDIFASIAGGLRVSEPGGDLGLLIALASSMRQHPLDADTCVIGEVGLGGEIRSVLRAESRIKEAIQMGFRHCLLPKRNIKGISGELREKINLIGIEMVEEGIDACLR